MKKLVKLFSFVLVAAMCVALCSCAKTGLRSKPVDLEHVMPLLMYVGCGDDSGKASQPKFSDEQLQQLTDAGINEYVLLTTFMPTYYCDIDENGNAVGEPQRLCTKEDIYTLTMEDLGVDSEYQLQLKQEQVIRDTYVTPSDNKSTINQQIDYEIELAKRILAINPNAKFWFSLPHTKMIEGATFYAEHYMDIIYPKIKIAFSEEEFDKNVGGLYWSTEDAGGTVFDTENQVDFGNPIVKAAKYCSDILHEEDKTLMWIPYTTMGQQYDRIGFISNLTDVFDYVYLQPGYLWHEEKEPFVNYIKNSVEAGAVLSTSGTIYGGEKKSSTVIGVEIELDNKVVIGKEAENHMRRYNAYVDNFSQFKSDKLIAIYSSNSTNMFTDTVTNLLFEWYK